MSADCGAGPAEGIGKDQVAANTALQAFECGLPFEPGFNAARYYVARWHEGAVGRHMELRELLGMSKHESAIWIQDANAIEEIVAGAILERKQKYGNSKSK